VDGQRSSSLILTAARLWDGEAREVLHDAFVHVDNGLIVAVGRTAELGTPDPNIAAHELGDVTLMPGLINAHTHVNFSASPTTVVDYLAEKAAGVPRLMMRASHNAQRARRVGVTTIRDCGTLNEVVFALREAIADGTVLGPRVVASGHGITITGGHCHFISHEADTVDDVRRAVRLQAKAVADFVKIFASGGNLTPGTNPFAPQYTLDHLEACVEEAHRLDKRVAAHAHSPEAVRRASLAIVDTIEHCSFDAGTHVGFDPVAVERIAANGIAIVPTVGISTLRTIGDPAWLAANPQALRAASIIRDVRANVGRMHEAGVTVVAGSDAGIPNRHFDDFPADVGCLAQAPEMFGAGLPAHVALVAATSGAARALALADTGLIRAGYRADLVAVDGNPLVDLGALTRTRYVMANGRVAIDRQAERAVTPLLA